MMMTKLHRYSFWLLVLCLAACFGPRDSNTNSGGAGELVTPPEGIAAVITLDNRGSSAWIVRSVVGQQVTETGENSPWSLTVGERYTVVNTSNVQLHPFALIDEQGNALVSQVNDRFAGALQNDPGINVVVEGDSTTFTFTQALADQTDSYYCMTPHPLMRGDITIG
ncbi:MAG: hypothetical protein AAF708_19700 [Deinococcota bacterium]